MEVSRISPAPRSSASRAHSTASRCAAVVPLREYTDRYIAAFREDATALGIEPVEDTPRATDVENLDAMAHMIQQLDAHGHTYRSDGSIYFKITTLPQYGQLARLDHEVVHHNRWNRWR